MQIFRVLTVIHWALICSYALGAYRLQAYITGISFMFMIQLLHVAKLKRLLIVDDLMTLNFYLQHSNVDGHAQ